MDWFLYDIGLCHERVKIRALEKQRTYFNYKHLGGDNFPHSRFVRNDALFEKLRYKVKKLIKKHEKFATFVIC